MQNEYLVAKIGVDTAENGPSKDAVLDGPAAAGWIFRFGAPPAADGVASAGLDRALKPPPPPPASSLRRTPSQLYQRRFLQPDTHFAAFFRDLQDCAFLHC